VARPGAYLIGESRLRERPPERSFVAAAEGAIMRAGHAVTDMAYFAARDTSPAEHCRRMVAQADVYVGIVGARYGAVVPEPGTRSYTELEFETATAHGLPRLVFLLPDGGDRDPRQDAFRRRLLDAGVTVSWAMTPAELELAIYQALTELRQGRRSRSAAGDPSTRRGMPGGRR
jgi:Domain of unknown function (DUF4062)